MRPGLFSTWQIYQISSARSGKRSQMARRRVIWEARGIVQASGSWWMKTSPQAVPGHTPVTWLLRFNRITGSWKFQPGGVVASDVRVARGAGSVFEQAGRLIRPSQDCSVSYGFALILN